MVLRNARMLAGIDLVVKSDTPVEKARALLASLIDHGLAEHVEDEPSAPVTVPAAVWQGLEAVKDSGTTNNARPARGHQDRRIPRPSRDGAMDRGPPQAVCRGALSGFEVDTNEGKL